VIGQGLGVKKELSEMARPDSSPMKTTFGGQKNRRAVKVGGQKKMVA